MRIRLAARTTVGALAALLVAACSSTPSADALPSGSLAPIAASAKTALAADVVDTHFDVFVARLDLGASFGARGDVIVGQLRRTRAAVATARTKSSATGGPRAASVRTATPSLFSVPLFAQAFGAILDIATSNGVNEDMPSKPLESSEEDAASHTRTTTALRTVEHASSTGSRVTYSMTWTYRMTVADTATGAQLLDSIDERTLVGTIDVCPDAAGNVPATLAAHAATGATKVVNGSGQQVHSESKSDNGFTGSTDDSAALRSVRREFKEQASWQNAGGTGSYETSMSVTHGASSDGGIVGGTLGGFSGTFTTSGDAGGIDPSKATAWTFAVDMWAMDEPFRAAQRLWRNGRCVVIVAPDYNAETPKDVADQSKPQHEERVDRASDTKFAMNLRHRFAGGALAQPVTAQLVNGKKSIDPTKLDAGSGGLTYKAPDEDDQRASVQLRSVSKRGIGTLVLDFRTGSDSLVLTITGTLTITSSFLGNTAETKDTLTIGPLEFKKRAQDVYDAAGEWQAQLHQVSGNALGTLTCDGSERGKLTMTARLEVRDGKKVWTVEPLDQNVEDGTGKEDCFYPPQTLRGVTVGGNIPRESEGTSGATFMGLLKPFSIPAEGGKVRVQGTKGSDRGTFTADGTAEGHPAK